MKIRMKENRPARSWLTQFGIVLMAVSIFSSGAEARRWYCKAKDCLGRGYRTDADYSEDSPQCRQTALSICEYAVESINRDLKNLGQTTFTDQRGRTITLKAQSCECEGAGADWVGLNLF